MDEKKQLKADLLNASQELIAVNQEWSRINAKLKESTAQLTAIDNKISINSTVNNDEVRRFIKGESDKINVKKGFDSLGLLTSERRSLVDLITILNEENDALQKRQACVMATHAKAKDKFWKSIYGLEVKKVIPELERGFALYLLANDGMPFTLTDYLAKLSEVLGQNDYLDRQNGRLKLKTRMAAIENEFCNT
jgi:hypothetical protein